MKKYCFYATSHNFSREIGRYVTAGFGSTPPDGCSVATPVVYGILREAEPVIKYCEFVGKNYIYVDHSYFFATRGQVFRPSDDSYFRLVNGGRHYNPSAPVIDGRWEKLGLPVVPFHKAGTKVVVVPLSKYVAEFHGVSATMWLRNTIKSIQQYTDREIVVKPKSQGTVEGLSELFQQAYCFVTHDSLSALSAIMNGVPVFCSKSAAVAPLAKPLSLMREIDSPFYPEPNQVLHHLQKLASQQFTLEEIGNGYAKSILEMCTDDV